MKTCVIATEWRHCWMVQTPDWNENTNKKKPVSNTKEEERIVLLSYGRFRMLHSRFSNFSLADFFETSQAAGVFQWTLKFFQVLQDLSQQGPKRQAKTESIIFWIEIWPKFFWFWSELQRYVLFWRWRWVSYVTLYFDEFSFFPSKSFMDCVENCWVGKFRGQFCSPGIIHFVLNTKFVLCLNLKQKSPL